MKKTIPALIGAAALMVGGVSFAKGQSEAKKNEEACTKFQKFQSSVQTAQNIGPNSTVGQLKTASADVEKNFKEFEKSATKAAKPQVENVKKSVKELRTEAQKIPNTATISEAQARLQPDIQQVRMSSSQLMTKLNCGMGGAGQQGMEQQGMGGSQGSQQGMEQQGTSGQGSMGGSSEQGMGGSQGTSDQGMNQGSQQGMGGSQGTSDQGSMGGSQGSSGQDQSGQGSGY